MAEDKIKVGDIVTVIRYTPATYPPGVKDELGTEELFQWMVGKDFEVRGFDDFGNLELKPRDRDTVWIQTTDVMLKARKAP